jgi:hypothetical protein
MGPAQSVRLFECSIDVWTEDAGLEKKLVMLVIVWWGMADRSISADQLTFAAKPLAFRYEGNTIALLMHS